MSLIKEETEVKKDIEWAKNRIKNTLKFEALNDREVGFKIAMKEALEIINQLDKPEVLTQELIYEKAIETHVDTANGEIQVTFRLEDLQNLLVPILSEMETVEVTEEQVMEWLDNNDFYDHVTAETVLENAVDKGELGYYGTRYSVVEKPVIPQFVAEYLDFAKSDTTLMRVLELANAKNEWEEWENEYDWISANDETFARAWLDGFTVEEEQKYVLLINITDKASKTNYETFLNKRGIFHSMDNESFNSEEFNWTEEEIKGLESGEILFEHFAVKVEELEE